MEKFNENLKIFLISILIAGWGVDCSPSFANFPGFRGGGTFPRFPPPWSRYWIAHINYCYENWREDSQSLCTLCKWAELQTQTKFMYSIFKRVSHEKILTWNVLRDYWKTAVSIIFYFIFLSSNGFFMQSNDPNGHIAFAQKYISCQSSSHLFAR